MNLEAQLHARWAADATLNGLLDASKVSTGIYVGTDDNPTFPFATLTFPGGSPRDYTNSQTIARPVVRIAVYHGRSNFDEAKAIMDAVVAAFDRAEFSLSGSDTVVNMQLQGEPASTQDDDGDWYFIADFQAIAVLA